MAEQISAQQRANNFSLSTRQNLQDMSAKKTTEAFSSLEFTLPKARLLSNIFVMVKAKISVKHASSTTLSHDVIAPFRLVSKYTLDLNNGFKPFSVSGEGLFVLNLVQPNANVYMEQSDYYNCPAEFTASATGADNDISFVVQLPVALNQRDPVGLILLQSEQTVVDLRLDIGSASDMFAAVPDGYTVELKSLEAKPMLETFSIPAAAAAMPDLSVLKLVQDRAETVTGAGQQAIKLSTGTIYRKLGLYITDANGNPAGTDFITSPFMLKFNTADCNYQISADMLRAKNVYDLGHALPKGVYIFDFTNQGMPNFGGVRDYIDTAKLSEFLLEFNTTGKGKVKIISECLSRLV